MSAPFVSPEAFASDTPPNRKIGIEAEDDVRRPNGEFNGGDLRQILTQRTFDAAGIGAVVLENIPYPEAWLINGGRLYVDVPQRTTIATAESERIKLEYCTAEMDGPLKAVCATRAGHKVLQLLLEAADIPGSIIRRAATISPTGNVVTSGVQPSFLIPERLVDEKTKALRTHLVTQLYAWGGMAGLNGYELSQKAAGIGAGIRFGKSAVGTGREGQKALALILHSSQDDDINRPGSGYARFEDRTKEESTEWGDFMGYATTSILLRVLEHPKLKHLNQRLQELQVLDTTITMRTTSSDLFLQQTHPMIDGRELTAIQIQRELYAIACDLDAKITLPRDEQFALEEWGRILNNLEEVGRTGDIRLVANRIGWAARLRYLRRMGCGDSPNSSDSEAAKRCVAWDRVAKPGGKAAYEQRHTQRIADDSTIARYVHGTDAEGRARQRALHIANSDLTIRTIQWNRVVSERVEGNDLIITRCELDAYANDHVCERDGINRVVKDY